MTTDLCTEDAVVQITAPQIMAESISSSSTRIAASSAAVELGRRLLLAARAGDTSKVLELMAMGAPFTTDWLGTSPLHLAAGNAHSDTCAVLLRAGVSRDARTKVERTPLHLAAFGGHAAVAKLLLDAGANVDCRDMLRMTPLHWAVQRGHIATVVELLSHGADPSLQSKFHKTPRSLAVELRRDDLVRLIDDAVKEREAAKSVHHLVTEQMAEVTPIDPVIPTTFEAVQRIQEIKPIHQIKTNRPEKVIKSDTKESRPSSEAAAAQLLRKHGITLLPTDDTSTVLNALQSGRTVVLSDAGKLMLKESETPQPVVSKPSPTISHNKNMVLTATPVKSPPKPGMKIFTLNNKLLAIPKDGTVKTSKHFPLPVKKIINPQDMQVKFVQLPPDAKIISPSKVVPFRRAVSGAHAVTSRSPSRPAVKIIMNKSNFNRLMASANRAEDIQEAASTAPSAVGETITMEELSQLETMEDSPSTLRRQLAAATKELAAARDELRLTRARLAAYEKS